MKRVEKAYTLFLWLFAVTTAFGDAGYGEYVEGSARGWKEHHTISMAAETVDIEILPEYIAVDASFTFLNDGPATEVPMYIPLYEGELKIDDDFVEVFRAGTEVSSDDIVDADFVRTFTLEIDGEPAEAEIVEELSSTAHYRYARWRVPFGEGEERTVRCVYNRVYHFGLFKKPGTAPEFVYILDTGGSWAGPIGEGAINVRRSLDLDYFVMFTSPGNQLEWKPISDYKYEVGAYVSWNTAPSVPAAEIITSDTEEIITWEFADYEPAQADKVRLVISGRIPVGGDIVEYMGEDWFIERLDDCFEYLGLPSDGVPGVATGAGLNFRTEPSPEAERVAGREKLGYLTPFSLLESRGEWWRVRTADGYEGWIRWRYVDPDTGEEFVYASFVD